MQSKNDQAAAAPSFALRAADNASHEERGYRRFIQREETRGRKVTATSLRVGFRLRSTSAQRPRNTDTAETYVPLLVEIRSSPSA